MTENTNPTASEASSALAEVSEQITGDDMTDKFVNRFATEEQPAPRPSEMEQRVTKLAREMGYATPAEDPEVFARSTALANSRIAGEDAQLERDIIALQAHPEVDTFDRVGVLKAAYETGTTDLFRAWRHWRAESLRKVDEAAGKDGGRIYARDEWYRTHAVKRPERTADQLKSDPNATKFLPSKPSKASKADVMHAQAVARFAGLPK